MNQIIYGLQSTEKPQIQEWGEKRHVPINVREVIMTDENGEETIGYEYDVVERVEQPINHDNIMAAAVRAKFTDEDMAYITKHFSSTSNEKVKAYKDFVSEMGRMLEDAEYVPAE